MLKELLGEELYSQVTEKLGDKKIMVDDGNFIPKSIFDQVNTEKKRAERERDTYKTQAEKYEGGMTKCEVEALEVSLENKYIVKSAINSKLSKIEDESIREFIESKIDKDKVTLNEDRITVDGLDEQFNSLSERYSTLISNTPSNTGGIGNHGRGFKKQTITKDQFNKMTYQERNKLYKENKDLYLELSK